MRGFGARSSSGFTFLELLVVTAIIMVLAMGALPMVRVSIRRQRETDYRYTLKTVRAAIDKFKDNCDAGRLAQTEMVYGADCYPTSLEQLVEGALIANDSTGKRMKFLRKIPIDPMTGKNEWGMRSMQDDATSDSWGGQNVFDVYSKSDGIALDDSKYKDW